MNDIVMRATEIVRKHLSEKYIGFTFTSETVSDVTGVSIKKISTVFNNLKRSGKLIKIKRVKVEGGGSRIVYVKTSDIEVFVLAPSKTGNKSGPRPKEYIKPDTESTWYRFNYGGVLRVQ